MTNQTEWAPDRTREIAGTLYWFARRVDDHDHETFTNRAACQLRCDSLNDDRPDEEQPVDRRKPMTHHGPMHGERTRRHQMVVDGNGRGYRDPADTHTIVTIYETPGVEALPIPRLHVEFMTDGHTNTAKLTVDEARELAGAAAEFVRLWQVDAALVALSAIEGPPAAPVEITFEQEDSP